MVCGTVTNQVGKQVDRGRGKGHFLPGVRPPGADLSNLRKREREKLKKWFAPTNQVGKQVGKQEAGAGGGPLSARCPGADL